MKATGLVLDAERGVDVEPDEFYDRSRFGNNGVSTDVTWVQLPSGLWGMRFNGTSSRIDCGNHRSLNPTGELTTEAWVSTEDISINRQILNKYGLVTEYAWYLRCLSTPDGFHARAYSDSAVVILQQPPNEVSVDTWYHIVVTFQIGDCYMYVNGTEVASGTLAGTVLKTAVTNLYIGWNERDNADWWQGDIVLVKMLNRVLTAGQILKQFEATRRFFGV